MQDTSPPAPGAAPTPAPPRFPLGQVVATPGALSVLEARGLSAFDLLARHQAGDWGDVPPEDARANELALQRGYRLLSSYTLAPGLRIWVITESDRAATTVLLPSEY